MRKTTSALLALCALAALAGRADDPEPPGAKAELKKLKGTWVVMKVVWGKREPTPPAVMTYTFDGDKLTYLFSASSPLPAALGVRQPADS